jgi:hypothetical protein
MSGDAALREALWRAVTRDGITDAEGGNEAVDNLLPVVTDALAEAEKRVAVKVLRMADDRLLTERDELRSVRARHDWPMGVEDAARTVRSLARRIESGEVTLP